MISKRVQSAGKRDRGFTVVEVMVVLAVTGILMAVAIPQMVRQRRLLRSVAVTREIMTQIRFARQLAMSQSGATSSGSLRRVAFTFQYDDATKEIKIIGPIPAGTLALVDPSYPNNLGSVMRTQVPLTQGGVQSSEILTGIPSGLPGSPSTVDGMAGVNLSGGKLNITFQPDGSVIDSTNIPVDRALFIYNNTATQATASAITVRGSSGRVKIWRYQLNANANTSKYVE